MVLKLDPNTSNASCNVGIAHYAQGDDAEGCEFLNACATRKIPIPRRAGTTKPKCGRFSLRGDRDEMRSESTIQSRRRRRRLIEKGIPTERL